MKINQLSLRNRIFLAMILLIIVASVLIVLVTIYQYKEQTDEYNSSRLERKEEAVKASINFWLESGNTFPLESKYLPFIFKDKIYEISEIEKVELNIYNLTGEMVKSSHSGFVKSNALKQLNDTILANISNSFHKRYIKTTEIKGSTYNSTYSYITDNKFKPIGILNMQYIQDNSEQNTDLKEFLVRISFVYLVMLAFAIVLAYFISSYVTKNIKAVTNKIKQTSLNKRNEKIVLENASSEITTLVNAYNNMVDELEQSAVKLAKGEREQAWREMAKQVAHEIKNPLTPMRLTIQSFQRKFDINDPNIKDKLNEYSKTLIQQIDTMSTIASAFSDFAKMPAQTNEKINVVEVVKHALDIFSEDFIYFFPKKDKIIAKLDKTQLIRIVTNLVKNAIQATCDCNNPKIEVTVSDENNNVMLIIADNGIGISDNFKEMVFEPKFTTKSSGMGLGLAMVKNIVESYGGSISLTSQEKKGTVFTIIIPKN